MSILLMFRSTQHISTLLTIRLFVDAIPQKSTATFLWVFLTKRCRTLKKPDC